MRIKNTELLVERAREHRRFDHIFQGTYGEAKTGPFLYFRGCAVGCLALPASPVELNNFLNSLGFQESPVNGYGWRYVENVMSSDRMRDSLGEQFGICPDLTYLAERAFENASDAHVAGDFVVEFAEALNEGAWIGEGEVARIERKLGLTSVESDKFIPKFLKQLSRHKGKPVKVDERRVEAEQEAEAPPSLVVTGV